jgi:hypothetical protein
MAPEDQAAEVVDDVVPAEEDRRGHREREQQPRTDPQAPTEPEHVRGDRAGEEDRDVQRGERGDALGRARDGVAQELQPLVEQQVLQAAHAGLGKVREHRRVGVDRPERRDQEVARGAQQPVERLRGGVEDPGLQVRGEDERGGQRPGDEQEEDHVRGRHDVGGQPRCRAACA